MLRLFKHLVFAILFVLFVGCSGGGGCTSGCDCAGITPLAEGFPTEQRIENAASLRLTQSGLGFLEQNIGTIAAQFLGDGTTNAGVFEFEIPQLDGNYSVIGIPLIGYDVCPNGSDATATPPVCVAEIDIGNAQLQVDAVGPHHVHIHGPLPLRIQNLPVDMTVIGIPGATTLVANGNGECPGANPQTFANIDIEVYLSIEIDNDPAHSRFGYSRVRVIAPGGGDGVDLPDSDQLSDAITFCGGGLDEAVLNGLKNQLVGPLIGGFIGDLGATLEEALCQQANPDLTPACPTGTNNVDGVCRYGTDSGDECASIILGLDGNINLGGLFASFSPGTSGAFDFLFAAGGHNERPDGSTYHWGDLNPIDNGATLGMYGGAEPMPLSGCVTPVDVALPANIPMPDEVMANDVSGWPMGEAPHFGLAISERFTNYLLAQMYNSGALCLGITGETIPQLSSNLLAVGLGATSMAELARQKQAAQVAIVVRPGAPPTVTFGNGTDPLLDPLVRLKMDQLSFDFYVWSVDRFIRALTATFDVDVPVNLVVTPEGLQPVIAEIGANNGAVSNSALLREDPAKIAGALEGLLGSLVGSLLGDSLPVVNINEQLTSVGLGLDIPASVEGMGSPGLRKLTKGSDNFLGIFAALQLQSQMSAVQLQSDTEAQLVRYEVVPEGLTFAGFTADNGPKAQLYLGSSLDDGGRAIEWQLKIDHLPWQPFSRERHRTIDHPWLRTEGRHVIQVRSRVVGGVDTLDRTPAEVMVVTDGSPPQIRVDEDETGQVAVRAADTLSPHEGIRMRMRLGQRLADTVEWDAWSKWVSGGVLEPFAAGDYDVLEVEAMDEEGNVGTVSHALIRGRGAADGSGCQCAVEGAPLLPNGGNGPWWLALAAAVGIALRRSGSGRSRRRRGRRQAKGGRALRALAAGAAVMVLAGSSSGCSCGDETGPPETGCRARGDCQIIEPGLVGAYTSAAVAPDGTLWVAGYLEANWTNDFSYGDLVVGRWDGERVDWRVVDGVPSEPPVDAEQFDPKGFRGGQTEPGDDVGLWTSIAIDGAGNPAVAYYDATNRSLRYAHYSGGWRSTMVQQVVDGDVGRYAKLKMIAGKPVVAFQFIEPTAGGAFTSGVRVAAGASAAFDTSWTFDSVSTEPNTPCREDLCTTGTKCVVSTGTCQQVLKNCDPECADGEACVDLGNGMVCEEIRSAVPTTYPDAVGGYIGAGITPAGELGLAYYHRPAGNLVVATPNGGSYTTLIVDGENAGADTGDRGIGASLFIDGAGDYHLAYVDGLSESVMYLKVAGGTAPGTAEVVDDGATLNGAPFDDGKHIVGDDTNIFVTQSGEVRIAYQDATAGTLRYAVGGPGQWTVKAVEQEGFAGFFANHVEFEGGTKVVNWWRAATPQTMGEVRLVSP
jgi:hypothetical protein